MNQLENSDVRLFLFLEKSIQRDIVKIALTSSMVLNSSTRRWTTPGLGWIVVSGAGPTALDFQFPMTSSNFSDFLTTASVSFFTVIISSNVTDRLDALPRLPPFTSACRPSAGFSLAQVDLFSFLARRFRMLLPWTVTCFQRKSRVFSKRFYHRNL